ncbi:MAG TPA: hypothetical protein VH042_03325 [Solirubrobacterales bacterium]|jgi:hypothetical protein|nr:hypothetical protein [Solirubrobacterales bacterium]
MRRLLTVTVLLALGLCVLPSLATAGVLDFPAAAPPQFRAALRAKLHMPPPRHGFESRFDLEAQHGYTVSVVGEGDIVAVEVSRPLAHGKEDLLEQLLGSKQSVTAYVARGTVTEHRVVASFGKFGKVDVRFRPTGRVVESAQRRGCRGADRFTSQLGVFVGGVRFSGEEGYVAVRSHRAKGRVRSPLHLDCSSRPPHAFSSSRARPVRGQPSFTPTFLAATWRHAVSSLELITFRIGKTTLFAAVNEESLGSMARMRFALVTAPSKKTFAYNEALTGATITPPEPFHGKGIYRAASDGTTAWTGSLSVSFPGAPRLSLTGEAFEAALTTGF